MEDQDQWRCEKCDTVYPAPEYRFVPLLSLASRSPKTQPPPLSHSYVLNLSIADHTNQMWLSGFNDIGVQLLGHTADELETLKNDDDGAFQSVVRRASGRIFNFGCRAKADSYNDLKKVRVHVLKAAEVGWVETANELLGEIARYGA